MAERRVAEDEWAHEASYCATHPRVESYLRCSRCERPICPRCLIQTPVGARCRACARIQRLPTFDARPRDLAAGLGAGLAAGLIGGVLLTLLQFGFFGLLLTFGVGYGVGRVVSAAANGRRATSLARVAAVATVLGLTYGPLLLLAMQAPGMLTPGLLAQVLVVTVGDPLRLLTIGVAALIAWYQVR